MPEAVTPFEKFLDKSDDFFQHVLNHTVNRFNANRKRTIRVKIDDYDVWSAHHTLALIIHPVLIRLKEKKQSAPRTDDEDVPEPLRSTSVPVKTNKWDTDDNHFKRWDWILDEMIWAFGEECDENSDNRFFGSEAYLTGEHAAWSDRKANGRRLFAKYYGNLWD
jgi:hypothetical protein